MDNSSNNNLYGLYVHVPFCLSRCSYCNFYSVPDLSKVDEYFLALNVELKMYRHRGYQVDTIYFGGGTPSIVDSHHISDVLESIYKYFYVVSNPEVTIEVNPGTVHRDKLRDYSSIGINRLSIGMQSTCGQILSLLGRLHSSVESFNVFYWARELGFSNIGIDLVYGIPGQNLSDWRREMEKIVTIEPEHLSCYLLTLEQGTALKKKVVAGKVMPLNDRSTNLMFRFTNNFLCAHNYNRYEVSNFSRIPSGNLSYYASKHNTNYWNFHNYIGFGPSAHSLISNKRWWNHSCVDHYIIDILKYGILPIRGLEELTLEQQIIEFMYLGLRQNDGISISTFQNRFGINVLTFFEKAIEFLLVDSFIQIQNDRIFLTNKGFLFLDSVVLWFCP